MNSILFLIAMATATVPSVQRPSFSLPADLEGKTVLYIGAHPDDEWGVAPVLAKACIDQGAKCHFVVASEANSGGCLFTIGQKDFSKCSEVRRTEMRASAAIFGGEVEFLGLDDLFYSFNGKGRDRTVNEWARASGTRESLVAKFRNTIRKRKPRLLFTFDPRHGSSCQAAHLGVAELVVEAVRSLPQSERPEVWLEQTDEIAERSKENEKLIEGIGFLNWPETVNETSWFDGNQTLKNGKTAYEYSLLARKAHPSQFPDEVSGKKVSSAPASARYVPLSPLSTLTAGEFCTALQLKRPTLDIPENQVRLREFLNSKN